MVYLELKAQFGGTWWNEVEEALKRARTKGITAEKSLEADKRHPHMSTPENDPLWFLSFDSLVKVVLDRKLWKLFEGFLTTKRLLRAKLEEVRPARNRIAHFRSLHADDYRRLQTLLRDVDRGFWQFCTSNNDVTAALLNDPAVAHFLGGDSSRSHNNKIYPFSAVATKGCVELSIRYSLRPRIRLSPGRKRFPRRGRLYDIAFFIRPSSSRTFLEYREILAATKPVHANIVHIKLDFFQMLLRVTIPAVLDPKIIIETIEDFFEACSNFRTIVPYRG